MKIFLSTLNIYWFLLSAVRGWCTSVGSLARKFFCHEDIVLHYHCRYFEDIAPTLKIQIQFYGVSVQIH